jgi:hypothetical protein
VQADGHGGQSPGLERTGKPFKLGLDRLVKLGNQLSSVRAPKHLDISFEIRRFEMRNLRLVSLVVSPLKVQNTKNTAMQSLTAHRFGKKQVKSD